MSQTVQWACTGDTTVRRHRSTGATAGIGAGKHLYVGRAGNYDFDAFLRVATDWTNVGKIVKAELVVFTDDGSGEFELTTTENPRVLVRRLTQAFTEGNALDGDWQANDYTNPGLTTSDAVDVHVSRAANATNRIDITEIVEDWAPATVKRHDSGVGGKATNFGLALNGTSSTSENWALWSRAATSPTVRPYIELTYEFGPTKPNAPANMTPTGAVASIGSFQGDFSDIRPTDRLAYSHVQVFTGADATGTATTNDQIVSTAHKLTVGTKLWFTSLTGGAGLTDTIPYYVRQVVGVNSFKVSKEPGGAIVDITVAYSALAYNVPVYDVKLASSNTEAVNGRFAHIPDSLITKKGVSYSWRARVFDNEGQFSVWTAKVTFTVSNTNPNNPVLTPVNASSYVSLDGVQFQGTFTDPDTGDKLGAYQAQLSPFPSGDPRWLDADGILWDTGKRYVAAGSTYFSTPYGGSPLAAGTYYWRARVFDQHDGVSNWVYAQIILTASFVPDPSQAPTAIQVLPRVPWRVVIKAMGANRAPGAVVAVLEDAKALGASRVFNSPGEAHFTLPVDHPQISVIEPRQTHYSIQFYTSDGWREKFAGLIIDADASERDVIFYGLDYLGALDAVLDERYDPSNPNKPAEKGGSYYVTAGKNTIGYIVYDQLSRAVTKYANAPTRFLTINQNLAAYQAALPETVAIYSTYQPTLAFVSSLIDSHRAGTGKRSMLSVRQKTAGGYELFYADNPGVQRDNLTLRYGELVQGYRVVLFGKDWASRVSGIGRTRDGIRVLYRSEPGVGIDESIWGRWPRAEIVDGVSDDNDLQRRVKQLAVRASKLGRQLGLGIRSGVLNPLDGYDIGDVFPVKIKHGAIDTDALGSGLWACMAVTWEASDQGQQVTTLTLWPKEDAVAPDANLIQLQEISPQPEWQIAWVPPVAGTATGRHYLDQTTGIVYRRQIIGTSRTGITGTP